MLSQAVADLSISEPENGPELEAGENL